MIGVVLVRFAGAFRTAPSADYAHLQAAGVRDPLDRTKVEAGVEL